MKRIYYIFTGVEKKSNEYMLMQNIRESFIAERTCKDGFDCKVLFLTYDKIMSNYDGNDKILFFPVDNPEQTNSGKHTSKVMLAYIENSKPYLVVFKGLGKTLSTWLVLKSRHMFLYSFIVGGKTTDTLLRSASYILAETDNQIQTSFQKECKKRKCGVLPKLIKCNEFVDSTGYKKEYDIISVGRLTPHKNHISLIPFFLKYKIAIVGDGEMYDAISKVAANYSDNVTMFRNLNREEVLKIVRKSRLMVHPCSWQKKLEGLPRVIAESFASAVPVVVFRKTIPDGFVNGKQGVMVDENDLYQTVDSLLHDNSRLLTMSNNAFVYAKNKYTEESVYKVIRQMYVEVFRKKKIDLLLKKVYEEKMLFLLLCHRIRKVIGKRIKNYISLKQFMSTKLNDTNKEY